MRILVADDASSTRQLLADLVAQLGHEPVPARDGTETWKLLHTPDAPRLALVDWMMPDLDGLELCRRLRSSEAGRLVYVILVSARTDAEDVVEGLAAGANDFVTKPAQLAVLAAKIDAGLRHVALHDEAARLRAFLEATLAQVDVGVLLSDSRHRILFASTSMERLSGTPLSNTIGRTRVDYIRSHAARFASEEQLGQVLRGDARPPDGIPATFAFEVPRRQVFRWNAVPVELPGEPGRLDIYRDVTEVVDRVRREQAIARVDGLTGVANRRGGEEFLDREWRRARRYGHALGVALFDLDHFKQVNDRHGHAAGDAVIRTLARELASQLRSSDLAVRWGGEELLAVLPDTNLDGARRLAERVRVAIEALEAPGLPRATVSGGVAAAAAEDADWLALVARADAKLYDAKSGGRNRIG